jgi:predicted TIM-barrel fold metal-dependent hydrolase
MKTRFLLPLLALALGLVAASCRPQGDFYTAGDFAQVPKVDAHFHYYTTDLQYIAFADSLNIRLVSPNVDASHSIDEQLRVSAEVWQARPDVFAFLGTFSVDSFGTAGFAEGIIARIRSSVGQGAAGIKIWKNIGMELQDAGGRYVMADDPAFEPVFQYLEGNGIPLLAHLGEPRNCWLPLEEMTDAGDRSYFAEHPQYHMYLHPEMPSYEDQIDARDHLLERYPALNFTGAHLGSLEWNVDELAMRLDRFPQFNADMAARIGHLKNQSVEDYDRVRDFLIQYQDRILYATDLAAHDGMSGDPAAAKQNIHDTWMADWLYLATDETRNGVKGLQLPREAVDKIFRTNAERIYRLQVRK